MLRARHLPFSIGITERDQWMGCMRQAMNEVGLEPGITARLEEALAGTADWMRNRAG
jgi:hemoglobin